MSVPAFRFKDADGRDFPEWEEYLLKDALIKNSSKNKNSEFNLVQSVSNKHGFINQDELFEDRVIASKDLSNYYVIKKGAFAYNPSRIDVGSLAYKSDDLTSVVSPLYVSFYSKPNLIADLYLFNWFDTQQFKNQMNNSFEGSVRNTLSYDSLSKICILLPCISEQTKIANFLTSVDEKITQLTQKYDLLTQYKKGVMQQIFTQKLRFKDDDGKNFSEWEEKILDDVCICLDNKRKPLNDAERQTMQGKIPYWGANNIMDYVNDYIFDEPIVLLAEDGGNFNEYKTRPIANISYGKCWVNNHTHVLKGKTGLSNEFLFYSLVHKNITGYVSGGTRAKLTKGEMLKILIDMPSSKEQTKIANFLTALDDKITATQTQLQAVKQYKQGLLQQMFV